MTEDKPHVVYRAGFSACQALILPSYRAAHDEWKRVHSHKDPHLIATLGRVIDPSAPVIDVGE